MGESQRAGRSRIWRAPKDRRRGRSASRPYESDAVAAQVLEWQQTAGNRATVQLLQTLQRDERTTRGSVSVAAETIASYFIGAQTSAKREQVLSTLLLNHDRAGELRSSYQSTWGRSLDTDLASLSSADALRALDSLDYGEIRPMSKVLIALGGAGTDTTTLFRVLRDCHRAAPAGTGFARFETMWTAVTGALPGDVFSDFKGATLAASLDDDLDGYELVKAHATLAYGDLRPIDQVYISLVQAGTDEAMLFAGLARCNPNTIESDFRAYEFRNVAFSDATPSIWDALDDELSGEDYRRALALVDREPNPEYGWLSGGEKTRRLGGNQRLVAIVRAAVHGAGTNVELIMSAIDEATGPERAELKKQVENPADPLGLQGFWGDLSAGELGRLRAKLGIAETVADAAGTVDASELADPTVGLLRGLGGVDSDTVFDKLKLSAGPTWARFKSEYEKNGAFARYVAHNTHMPESAYVATTIFQTDLDRRLDFCFGTFTDDEDYLFHLIGNFATNADRRRLSADGSFMAKLRSNLSGSEMARAITLLRPSDLTPQENARWMAQAVEREESGFFDLFSSTGEAVADENRELQAGTQAALLDAHLSPEERRLLEARSGRTQAALDDYRAARDEFANTASMVANVAVSVIIAGLTGGAAGPVLVAQLARAAAAMAVAKVLTEKVIRGDRFDMLGADGAVAFATGAVEGVMNVSGGLVAKGVAGAGLEAVGLSAQAASGSLFRGAARSGILAVTEGGLAGGSASLVDTMARDETWREGITVGLERVAANTATGAATGGAMALSLHGALAGIRQVRGGPNAHLPLSHHENPLVGRAMSGDHSALTEIAERMGRWEVGMRDLQSDNPTGVAAGLSAETRAGLVTRLVRHRNAIVEHLQANFDAAPVGNPSREAGSDIDLNVRGDNAGERLIAAEQYLDTAHPGWRAKYRLGLLVDAGRIGSLEEVMASLPPEAIARVRARVTQETVTLMYARRLHLADASERAAMEASPPPGVDVARARQLGSLDDAGRQQMRNHALLEGDRLATELRSTTDPALRQQLAERLTFQQMLANTMDDEAYLSGGGVKGFALGQRLTNPFEQYQALLDQVGMIAHAVHEAGGVLPAARSYELFKYVNRICALFEQAGIQDERLAFFKNWSDLAYRVDRDATGALDRPGGARLAEGADRANVTTDIGAPHGAPSDQFLLDNYTRFGEMVEHHGAELERRVQQAGTEGGGGARPGSSPLLRLPRPADVPGGASGAGGPSPAMPTRLAGDDAALIRRLVQTRSTLEQEIARSAGFPAQLAAATRALEDLRAKPLRELTPADLAVSSGMQRVLFDMAGGAVERMKGFARGILGDIDAEIISIRKRDELDEFVAGVLGKCVRKDYPIVLQMDDIIRGRLNITNGPDVERVARAMQEQSAFRVKEVVAPRTNDAGVVRYPRYHVIVEDPQTGLTHEWQIGTRATSSLYETQGIVIPSELQEAAGRLGKHFRADIHDIEYDVFQAFHRSNPSASAELGIPGFIARVAEASQRSGAGAADTALSTDLATLHAEASRLLRALVDRQGADAVARLLH